MLVTILGCFVYFGWNIFQIWHSTKASYFVLYCLPCGCLSLNYLICVCACVCIYLSVCECGEARERENYLISCVCMCIQFGNCHCPMHCLYLRSLQCCYPVDSWDSSMYWLYPRVTIAPPSSIAPCALMLLWS